MTQPYQETGNSLLATDDGPRRRGTSGASPGLQDWRQSLASERDPQHAPALLVGRKELSYQALLRTNAVKVSRLWVFWRLLRLLFFGASFWVSVLWHRITITDAEEREKVDAVQFRLLLVKLGGVLIKVGQQLSQRPDLVPPAYCDELRVLLDELPNKIDRADVEAAIEEQTKKPWWETFAEFNFETIGSASVSCVYRAVLHNDDEVAVKVRRPNIQKAFTADLDALDWLLFSFEFLTIWRPGMSSNFRLELRDILLEELDFRREARNQELFRRYHKRRKKLNVTAPKVYYELSGEALMVSEFVHGHKVQKIIEAMESGDEVFMARLRHSGIDMKKVAKHLIRSRYYSFHECPLFHGDPHPSNILVQDNNRIVMLDFGACGVFSQRDRNLMWQMNYYYSRDDVGGMVNMVLSIMEPIYPVNIHAFRRELTDAWWTGFYGIKSNHAQWWERTSFRLWLRFFELIRQHKIPIPRNMVRMIRATLLYDTVAARLYPKLNVFKEFEKYSQGVAKRTKRRIQECAVRQILLGPDDANYLKLQQIVDIGDGLLQRLQKFLDDPNFTFSAIAGKVYSAIRSFVRMFLLGGMVALAGIAIAVLFQKRHTDLITNPIETVPDAWRGDWLLHSIAGLWLVSVLLLVFAYGRRVYIRFGDADD
ncbi:MAG: ubiquinone biosynthesis protein [Acidobacteriota bacterium]|nr:ubiquinone biosynthesis protein [Acidobacteriota bacterium]